MLTHSLIWAAIDALAQKHGYSTAGLAKRAGLDSTTFNRSKRISPEGKMRWPSTESISLILAATGETTTNFLELGEDALRSSGIVPPSQNRSDFVGVPVIPLDKMHITEAFDLNGHPLGDGWKMIELPPLQGKGPNRLYGVRVIGDAYLPTYRPNDILMCQPFVRLRAGMRALLLRRDRTLLLGEVTDVKGDTIHLTTLDTDRKAQKVALGDCALTAQIQWLSQ